MSQIAYIERSFSAGSLALIEQADAICAEYTAQGFDLTLRQLYYQFVARGLIANRDREYKRLGSIVNDARLAGRLDWDYIVDRTRNLEKLPHWNDPAHIVRDDSHQFNLDRWADQQERVEVWIEKDALVGVIEGACQRNDVPFFSCRGYTSQSEVWGAAQRIGGYLDRGAEQVTVVHLGDHDPSGIDMTRDIEDRLRLFLEGDEHDPDLLTVQRIALNFDQVRQYNPPPNPAKVTDSRARAYMLRHGRESWELDALEPTVLDALIEAAIAEHRQDDVWEDATERQQRHREQLAEVARRWPEVVAFLDSSNGKTA